MWPRKLSRLTINFIHISSMIVIATTILIAICCLSPWEVGLLEFWVVDQLLEEKESFKALIIGNFTICYYCDEKDEIGEGFSTCAVLLFLYLVCEDPKTLRIGFFFTMAHTHIKFIRHILHPHVKNNNLPILDSSKLHQIHHNLRPTSHKVKDPHHIASII